jgi:hypothetical protein
MWCRSTAAAVKRGALLSYIHIQKYFGHFGFKKGLWEVVRLRRGVEMLHVSAEKVTRTVEAPMRTIGRVKFRRIRDADM